MKFTSALLSSTLLPFLGIALCACAPGDSVGEDLGTTSEAILGGTGASAQYPEAATIDGSGGSVPAGGHSYCSATLIAPRVILTAAHCVDGPKTWFVNVGSQGRTATRSVRFDWQDGAGPAGVVLYHDLALLFLDQPITLASYPTIAQAASPANSKLTLVGRVQNSLIYYTLWGAADTGLSDGTSQGIPFQYISTPKMIEEGDSGGPDFLFGTHTIVGVNSASWYFGDSLARVDQLYAWITRPIDDSTVFVRESYLDVLAREADAGGLAFYTSYLQSCNGAPACLAANRISIVRGMLESPESIQQNPDLNPASPGYKSAYVTHCYTSLLRRQPDAGGLTFWVNSLNATGDYSGLVGSFITSAEYRQRFGAQ